MKVFKTSILIATLALSGSYITEQSVIAGAYAQEKPASEKKARRTPALGARVYEQLARAQETADGGDVPSAIEILDRVNARSRSMNSYEKAMMHNFYGFIYYNADQVDNAIGAFEEVVAQDPIPETLEQSTLYSLAQLHMAQGHFDKTIEFIERWEALQANGVVPAKTLVLKAQAMYQKKDYQRSSIYINQAVAQVESEGAVPAENWYVLQRAIFYELKQPEQVTEVLVKMIRHYEQPKYWVQLSGMYGELEEEKKQLAIIETAYQKGYVTSATDLFNLAQLYYYHQVPYKGALVMEKALEDGVLDRNLRNLRFLSQCLSAAQEQDKAIPVMSEAAKLSEDGELNAQLAQIYLNRDEFTNAIDAAKTSLEKGGLRNPGTSHLVLGMAYFNQEQYVQALDELSKAQEFDASKGMAQQWTRFVSSEKASAERLAAELDI